MNAWPDWSNANARRTRLRQCKRLSQAVRERSRRNWRGLRLEARQAQDGGAMVAHKFGHRQNRSTVAKPTAMQLPLVVAPEQRNLGRDQGGYLPLRFGMPANGMSRADIRVVRRDAGPGQTRRSIRTRHVEHVATSQAAESRVRCGNFPSRGDAQPPCGYGSARRHFAMPKRIRGHSTRRCCVPAHEGQRQLRRTVSSTAS